MTVNNIFVLISKSRRRGFCDNELKIVLSIKKFTCYQKFYEIYEHKKAKTKLLLKVESKSDGGCDETKQSKWRHNAK